MAGARDVFEREARRGYEPRLRGVAGSCRFEIEGVGTWHVRVKDGALTITECADDAECVIGCCEEDFLRLVEGRQNLLTAALQGRVRVRGNLMLAKQLHGLLRAPGRGRTESP